MVTIEITSPGIYPHSVGTRLTLNEEPLAWKGKYRVISTDEGKTLEVATPEPEQEEGELEALRREYEERFGEEPDGRWKVGRLRKALDASEEQG